MLKEIATWGWFKDTVVPVDLLAVSTWGWYVIDGEVIEVLELGLFQDFDGLFDGGLWF